MKNTGQMGLLDTYLLAYGRKKIEVLIFAYSQLSKIKFKYSHGDVSQAQNRETNADKTAFFFFEVGSHNSGARLGFALAQAGFKLAILPLSLWSAGVAGLGIPVPSHQLLFLLGLSTNLERGNSKVSQVCSAVK